MNTLTNRNSYNSISLTELTEKQIIKTNNKTSYYVDGQNITFADINAKATLLAHFIKMHVIGKGNHIVIDLDTSIENVISILAILKSGNIYIPIHFHVPPKLTDLVNAQSELTTLFKNNQVIFSDLLKYKAEIEQMPACDLELITNDDYILFSSGTTGSLEGMRISQNSLLDLLFTAQNKLDFTENQIFFALAPSNFDNSVVEFYLQQLLCLRFSHDDNKLKNNLRDIISIIEKYNSKTTPITSQISIFLGINDRSYLLNQISEHPQLCYKRKIIFGFVGQGPQYISMANDLYLEHPKFRETINECCKLIKKEAGFDLIPILFPRDKSTCQTKNLLTKTEYAQLSLFIIEYALAKLLIDFGIRPDGMIGHSLGEYVAATISEVFDLEDAIKLIIARSKLMTKTKPGVMLAVPLASTEILPYLDNEVDIAARNAPNLSILAGSKKSITNFIEKIKPLLLEKNLNYQYLHTDRAFHSQYMEPILDEFLCTIKDIQFNNPKIPYISNISGSWITPADIKNNRYWATHMRSSVLFSDGIAKLNLNSDDIFIEIGPGNTLSSILMQNIKNKPHILNTLPHFGDSSTNSYKYFINTISKTYALTKNSLG